MFACPCCFQLHHGLPCHLAWCILLLPKSCCPRLARVTALPMAAA